MKQVLSKEEVAKVMSEMASQAKKVTLNSLHAALNHRGSMTTLMKLKSEIELAAQPVGAVASPEGLATFWELWALAVDEGRKQQDSVIGHLREDEKALAVENERLDGLATAAENRAKELEQAKSATDKELVAVRTAPCQGRIWVEPLGNLREGDSSYANCELRFVLLPKGSLQWPVGLYSPCDQPTIAFQGDPCIQIDFPQCTVVAERIWQVAPAISSLRKSLQALSATWRCC